MFRKLKKSKPLTRVIQKIARIGCHSGKHKSPVPLTCAACLIESNGRFSYGCSSFCGRRDQMEDFFDVRVCTVDGIIVGLFGVYDGHGGSGAALYVQRKLFENLLRLPMLVIDPRHAIVEAYRQTDAEFLESSDNQHGIDGSTATTAILIGNQLFVANLGDCRAVLSKWGDALPLSNDHKPDRIDERMRIEGAGGSVLWDRGCWRVDGKLAVSRAFGNRYMKEYVTADPDIEETIIDAATDFLVIASDGFWDLVSNQEAITLVQYFPNPDEAATYLAEEAFVRGSLDNITCMVIRFHHNTGGSSTQ